MFFSSKMGDNLVCSIPKPRRQSPNSRSAYGRVELETYSNVHRGSGHNSMVSTHLYEQAGHCPGIPGAEQNDYVVIFCTPRRAELLQAQLAPNGITVCRARHWPATRCQGVGCRSQGAAPTALLSRPVAGRQACLPRLGHLGQGARQIRGRHARDRQCHCVCQGTAADPTFGT